MNSEFGEPATAAMDVPDIRDGMGPFGPYLTVWVALGQFFPARPAPLVRFEYAQVSIPVAVLLWAMNVARMGQREFGAGQDGAAIETR